MASQIQPRVYSAGDEVVPGYVLQERLGKGMSGDVWIAQGPGRTRVALKIVRTLSKLGGRKELAALQTIRNINHTNLCPLHGFWLKDREGNLIAEAAEDSWVKDETTQLPDKSSEGERSSGTVPVHRLAQSKPGVALDGIRSNQETDQPPLDETMPVTSPDGFEDESTVLPGVFPKTTSGSITTGSTTASNTRVPRTAPASEMWKQAEELIVVMGLGDCTLFDELQKVRRAAGIAPKDRTTVLGLPDEEIIRYVRESASAIDLLNIKHRIFHRDIKPQNILVVSGGAQVCDFGLAHKMDADSTATQQVMATPVYAPPELLDNKTVDKSVDQYCLAVTAFELRTGTLPFDATSMSKIVLAKCENRFNLDAVAMPERVVYMRALNVDPSKRYANCREMVDALAVAMGIDHVKQTSYKSVAWAAALIVALIVAPLIVYAYNLSKSTDSSADLVASATQQYQAITPQQDTMLARDSLRLVLEKLIDASESRGGPDDSIQSLAKVATTDFSGRLDSLCDQLDQHDASVLALLGQDDLLLSRTVENQPPSLFPTDQPHAEAVRSAIVLRRALMERAEGIRASDDLQTSGATSELRSRLKDQPDSFSTRQKRIAFLLIALSHRSIVKTKTGLAAAEPLADLVQAHQAIDVEGLSMAEIPSWLQQPWFEMRDASQLQFSMAAQNGQLDSSSREKILRTWPDLFINAKLIAFEKALIERRFDDAEKEGQSLDSPDATASGLKPETEVKQQLYLRMTRSLLDVQLLPSTTSWLTNPDNQLPVISGQVKDAMASWWTESARRWFMVEAGPTSESIRSVVAGVDNLSKLLHRSVPADIQSALLCDWISQSEAPTTPELMANWIQQSVDSDEISDAQNRLGWLRAAVKVDHRIEPLSGSDLKSKTLQNVDAAKSILDRLPAGYADFVLGESFLNEENPSDAMTTWNRLKDEKIRQSLGTRRSAHLAELWLELAVVTSRIADTEPIRVRYADVPEAALAVSTAQWWADGSGSRLQAAFRLPMWLQEWSVRVALRADDAPPPQLQPRDRTALERLVLNEVQFEPADGQLVACAFGLAKWVWDHPASIAENDEAWWWDLLVTSADAAIELHQGQGEELTDAIVESHIVPVAQVILSSDYKGKPNRNAAVIRLLSRFDETLEDPGLADPQTVEDYRREKVRTLTEIALRSDPKDAIDHWLEIGELVREFAEADSVIWTPDRLDQLRGYLNHAKNAGGEAATRYLLLNAFELAMRADGQVNPDQRLALCRQSAQQYAQLIDNLRQTNTVDGASNLYEALWRRADLLVNLAFLDVPAARPETLFQARANSKEAVEIFDKFQLDQRGLSRSASLYVQGNVLEDLAFYAQTDPKERHQTFQESTLSFTAALEATAAAPDKGLRNRIALARCTSRHVETCGDLLAERNRSLSSALEYLGEPPSDERTPPLDLMQWYGWASKIEFLQGDFEVAIEHAQRGVEIAEDASRILKLGRDQANYWLADLLSHPKAGSFQDYAKALTILDAMEAPDDSIFWNILEIRFDILTSLEKLTSLPELLDGTELVKRIPIGMKRSPISTMRTVGLAGRRLQAATKSGAITKETAKQKIDAMLERLVDFPEAKSTREFLNCYRNVVTDASPNEQVRNWISAIQSGPVDSRALAETQRLMFDSGFQWAKDKQFSSAFGPIDVSGRKVITDSLSQWGRGSGKESVPLINQLIGAINAAQP